MQIYCAPSAISWSPSALSHNIFWATERQELLAKSAVGDQVVTNAADDAFWHLQKEINIIPAPTPGYQEACAQLFVESQHPALATLDPTDKRLGTQTLAGEGGGMPRGLSVFDRGYVSIRLSIGIVTFPVWVGEYICIAV